MWLLAREFWTRKHPDWPDISMGLILGSGLATFKDDAGNIQLALARLYKILITESIYLIWKLRCDRSSESDSEVRWAEEKAG